MQTELSATAGESTSIQNIPGPNEGYTDIIDNKLNSEEPKALWFPLRPSSAGHCSRKLAYELADYFGLIKLERQKLEPTLKRIFSLGQYVEWHSIKFFEKVSWDQKDFNVRYKQQSLPLFRLDAANADDLAPPLVEGSLDIAVMNKGSTSGGFGDVKSAKDKFHKAFKTSWDWTTTKLSELKSLTPINGSKTAFYADNLKEFLAELNDPFFEDNFRQLNTYCNSEFARLHGIDHGFIYRYNKNDSRHIEVRFRPSPEIYQEFIDKCNKVYKLVKNSGVDAIYDMGCDFTMGSAKAAFCDCRFYSGDNQDACRKAYFNTFPKKSWPTNVEKLERSEDIRRLFDEYISISTSIDKQGIIEDQIIDLLAEAKVQKIKLSERHVFEVKHLKTGGVANGPRTVLRVSKV